MTAAVLPAPAAATVLDGAVVRAACNRVKFAAGEEFSRFGRADGVTAIQDDGDVLFIATDGTILSMLRVPGNLGAPRLFFPLAALIGSGKRASRGMPKADPMLAEAGHSFLSAGAVETARLAEVQRGPTVYVEPDELDGFARLVRSAGTDSVRLDVADDVLLGHGSGDVVLEFDVAVSVSDAVGGEFPRTYLCPKRLADAARRAEDGPARIAFVSIANGKAPPHAAIRQAGFSVMIAGRTAPKAAEGGDR